MEGVTNWLPYQRSPNIAGAYMAGQRAALENKLISTRNQLGQQELQANRQTLSEKQYDFGRRQAFDHYVANGQTDKARTLYPQLYANFEKVLNSADQQQIKMIDAEARLGYRRLLQAQQSANPVAATRALVKNNPDLYPGAVYSFPINNLHDVQHALAVAKAGAETVDQHIRENEWSKPTAGQNAQGEPVEFQTNPGGGTRIVPGVQPIPHAEGEHILYDEEGNAYRVTPTGVVPVTAPGGGELSGRSPVRQTVAERISHWQTVYNKLYGPASSFNGTPPTPHEFFAHNAPDLASYIPEDLPPQGFIKHAWHYISGGANQNTVQWPRGNAATKKAPANTNITVQGKKYAPNQPVSYNGKTLVVDGEPVTAEQLSEAAARMGVTPEQAAKEMQNGG